MKKVLFVLSLVIISCATLQEAEIPEQREARKESCLTTKAMAIEEPIDSLHMISVIQSSHVMTLIRSVIFKDGVYIQSLSEKDMLELGINEVAKSFSDEYIQLLNHQSGYE